MAITADDMGDSAMGWALWKALDWVSARVLEPGPAGAQPAVPLDQAALIAAVRELGDDQSAVVQALAEVLGKQYDSTADRDLALDRQMAGLSRERGLVVAAVVLYANSQGSAVSTT